VAARTRRGKTADAGGDPEHLREHVVGDGLAGRAVARDAAAVEDDNAFGKQRRKIEITTAANHQLAMTLGVRMYDRKLTVATRVLAVDAKRKKEIPDSPALSGSPDLPPSAAYMITNLYMGYQPTQDITAALSVDNLFNKQYAPYLNTYAGGTTGSTLLPFPSPGVTVKGELRVRLGGGAMAPEPLTPWSRSQM
jgi:outer membrane receptor protein involved in Fe transport